MGYHLFKLNTIKLFNTITPSDINKEPATNNQTDINLLENFLF